MSADIVTGDYTSLAVTLKKNNTTFTINPSAVIKAALVSIDHTCVYSSSVEQSSLVEGANWAESLVVVELPPDSTSGIDYQGPALLEIQVSEDNKPKTWFVLVRIIRGNI